MCLFVYKSHVRTIWEVKFAPQGYFFGSCSADKTAILWSTAEEKCHRIFVGHTQDVNTVDFTQNMNILITSSDD